MLDAGVRMAMHRRHVASIVALATLALTAGCVGALGQTDGPAVDANRTITVTATDDVTAEPDQAIVRVAAVARADTADDARERLAENVSTLRTALVDAGLTEDQFETSGYAIHEERRDRTGPESPDGAGETTYVARQSFAITLDDIDRAGEIVDVAVAGGASRVEGVQFTLSDDARDDDRADALTAAMESARSDAETLAAAEDLSVGDAVEITTGDVRPVPYADEVAVADDGAGTVVDDGPVTVTATVDVAYELR